MACPECITGRGWYKVARGWEDEDYDTWYLEKVVCKTCHPSPVPVGSADTDPHDPPLCPRCKFKGFVVPMTRSQIGDKCTFANCGKPAVWNCLGGYDAHGRIRQGVSHGYSVKRCFEDLCIPIIGVPPI